MFHKTLLSVNHIGNLRTGGNFVSNVSRGTRPDPEYGSISLELEGIGMGHGSGFSYGEVFGFGDGFGGGYGTGFGRGDGYGKGYGHGIGCGYGTGFGFGDNSKPEEWVW